MAKVKNLEQLRELALETLDSLRNGVIDTSQAAITGKLCETVIATAKQQIEYAKLTGDKPYIPFIHDCHQAVIDVPPKSKQLPDLKSSHLKE